MNNVVLKITFSDGLVLIARLCFSMAENGDSGDSDVKAMLSKIAALGVLKRRTTIPVPEVFAFDVSPSNKFGYPNILMECLKGKTLGATITRNVPPEYHQHIARQFADVLFQLQNLSFDKNGKSLVW